MQIAYDDNDADDDDYNDADDDVQTNAYKTKDFRRLSRLMHLSGDL